MNRFITLRAYYLGEMEQKLNEFFNEHPNAKILCGPHGEPGSYEVLLQVN